MNNNNPRNLNDSNEVVYDDQIVRWFSMATLIWGAVAFLLGVIVALQLADWRFNFGVPWLTFGRLRPLHTNAAIFAFGGNAIFAGIYHSSQRVLKARLYSDFLSKVHFWGWQLVIVLAAVTLLLGYSHGKEYAELEWPIDLLITLVWVVFAVNFFGTLFKRRERHIYVALWFYIATIVAVAVLHIVNSLEIPVGVLNSYPIFAGVQDALVQWWYGHNAVAFFLTTPFLGLMYYYVPKAVNLPVYSYRLSIIHFWALVFLYIWAGPHHLLYSALPEWAQTLGMIFSLMLWAPSWGGMVNGLLTMRGAWHRLRTEPVLKFFAAAMTFYGMATFEGPLLSIKVVNAISHGTDWTIGHVHSGTLGWNGLLTFGILYYLVPKLWNTKLYSVALAEIHFWFGMIGTVIYMLSMWVAGITQSLMLREIDNTGKLAYPDFVETVTRIIPMYWVRAAGGAMFLVGFIIMLYNMWKTIQSSPGVATEKTTAPRLPKTAPALAAEEGKHRALEGLPAVFSVLVLIAILVGTLIELIPALTVQEYIGYKGNTKPLSPLSLAGRDLYVREGCYVCHTQMVRPIVSEKLRYGDPSLPEDSIYDHPHQWGSKRTGPDLARVGGKFPDLWHFRHMIDPREISPGSIMPSYQWMMFYRTDMSNLPRKMSVLKTLGVPYTDTEISNSIANAQKEAEAIAAGLQSQGAPADLKDKEITAIIAYLQSLGKQTTRPK
jgi:cytochrome c oxidase cbb3-type subunit I/II